jgi:hypothetical protein
MRCCFSFGRAFGERGFTSGVPARFEAGRPAFEPALFWENRTMCTNSEPKTIQHWRALATTYMAEHKCRWAEACLAIKKKYPEAREAFGAPPALASG